MLTSKERADLRATAHHLRPIFSIGKDGISDEFIKGVDSAIEQRELVKINILQNCDIDPKEAAETLRRGTRSEVVQVIGKKITLYRKTHKKETAPAAAEPHKKGAKAKKFTKAPKPRQKSTKR